MMKRKKKIMKKREKKGRKEEGGCLMFREGSTISFGVVQERQGMTLYPFP